MKELVEVIAKALVDDPDECCCNRDSEDEKATVIGSEVLQIPTWEK